eukprot:9082790-Pyramimonas_sp.AAC.1
MTEIGQRPSQIASSSLIASRASGARLRYPRAPPRHWMGICLAQVTHPIPLQLNATTVPGARFMSSVTLAEMSIAALVDSLL